MIRFVVVSLLAAVTFAAHAADPAKILRIASSDIDTLDTVEKIYKQHIGE